MKKLALIVLIFAAIISCNEDNGQDGIDCSLVDCIGFPSLNFELLNQGENVFEENLLAVEEISFTGNFPDPIELTTFEVFLGERETEILFLSSFAWEEGTYNFNINIGTEFTSEVVVEVEESPKGECCGGIPFFKSLLIDGEVIQNPNEITTLEITL